MEYGEHLSLLFVPGIFVGFLVILFCLLLIKFDGDGHVMDAIVKITLGDCCLIIEPGHTDGHVSCQAVDNVNDNGQASGSNPHERTHLVARRNLCFEDGHIKAECCYNLFVSIMSAMFLSLTTMIFWITLVEDIIFGRCIQEADCFILSRRNDILPDVRRVNCSTYEPDADYNLICYKAGFYLFEAFSSTGGLLYIITTFNRIIFPLATKGHKIRRYVTTTVLFIIAVISFLTCLIASVTLPSSTFGIVFGGPTASVVLTGSPMMLIMFLILMYPRGNNRCVISLLKHMYQLTHRKK